MACFAPECSLVTFRPDNWKAVLEQKPKGWDWTMNINARSLLFAAQRLAPLMAKRGGGSIVSITSPGSSRVMPDYVVVGGVNPRLEVILSPRRIELVAWPRWAKANLNGQDALVVESTSNAWDFYDQVASVVGQAVVANPRLVKLIAAGRVKTDKVDTLVLAKLLATGFMPTGFMPTGFMPSASMPVGSLPTGFMPAGSVPTGFMPFSTRSNSRST